MKRDYTYYLKRIKLIIAGLGLFITTFNFYEVSAQKYPPKPNMWVPKADGINRKDNFLNNNSNIESDSKYSLLSQKIQEPETASIFYSLKSFQNLLATFETQAKATNQPFGYFRVYIASYFEDSGGYVPKGFNKHLTLIFAPALSPNSDVGDYYVINPDGTIAKLPKSVKNGWINYYAIEKLSQLHNTIYKNDPDNQSNNPESDTRSVVYHWANVLQLVDTEANYQIDTNHIALNGIQIDFAAYNDDGNKNGKYKNRLIIQFEFTKLNISGQSEEYYIEDTKDFKFRSNPLRPEPNLVEPYITNDNGQLCPPANGCPN
jgi:hypothetical protein